jgi:hypothetical protein
MGQYANANLHREGAEFFAARLKEFAPQLSESRRRSIGALRTGHANQVPLCAGSAG